MQTQNENLQQQNQAKVQELTAKRNRLISDADGVLNRGDMNEYHAMLKEIDDIQSQIDALGLISTRLRSLNSSVAANTIAQPSASGTPSYLLTPRQRTNAAWRSWLKSGLVDLSAEHRALLTTTDEAGGGLIPEEIQNDYVSLALKAYAPLTQFCRVRWSDDSAPVKAVRVDDRNNGLVLIQEGGGPGEADPTTSSSTVFYDQLSTGIVQYSNQLLQDSSFDLTSFLTDLTGSRFGRGLERILTRSVDSSGTATPNNPGIMNAASVASTTATLSAGIGWNDVINVYDALDAAFLPKAVWQMSTKTRTALLRAEDGTSRPYFVPAPSADSLDMLLGRPVVINQSLDLPTTANGIPIVFGSLYEGLEIMIRRLRVLVFRERWADLNLSAISTYTGIGSTALAPGALQALKLAAS